MALKIRLARGGSKKRPFYSIVVADIRSPRDGRYVEKIGTYNPLLPRDGERVKLDAERAKYWMSVGAVPTDRVSRFLNAEGLLKREPRNNPNKAKPGKKAQERIEEKAAKVEEAKEAEAAAKEEAKAAEETAKEEAKAAAEAPAELEVEVAAEAETIEETKSE